MTHRNVPRFPLIAMAIILVGAMARPALAATDPAAIGEVHSVEGQAHGTVPGQERQRLGHDDLVYRDERVETGAGGALSLLFADDTNLRLGEHSEILLDELIYDPDAKTGKLHIRLGTGVFRFISGHMPKKQVKIETPVATIGIRGTDFLVEVSPDGETKVSVLSGEVAMTPTEGTETMLVPPGYAGSVGKGKAIGRIDTCAGGDCGLVAKGSAKLKGLVAAPPGQGKSKLGRASKKSVAKQASRGKKGKGKAGKSGTGGGKQTKSKSKDARADRRGSNSKQSGRRGPENGQVTGLAAGDTAPSGTPGNGNSGDNGNYGDNGNSGDNGGGNDGGNGK